MPHMFFCNYLTQTCKVIFTQCKLEKTGKREVDLIERNEIYALFSGSNCPFQTDFHQILSRLLILVKPFVENTHGYI
jgi:hypothetical protein